MNKRNALRFDTLEARCNPATTGVTWPDGMHMTLSFAPDGTQVGTASSNLFAKLDAEAQTSLWQREVLAAFQAWAIKTNVNIGVVGDSGARLGTHGAVQGDAAFGDIRLAAIPLPEGTLVTNTPFQWSGSTWSGDVILNSNYLFRTNYNGTQSGNYDLFTVMLNEAGNVFGVKDTTTDTSSAVFNTYNGRKTGLNATDVTDIQSLYGARSPDFFDGAAGKNGTLAAATTLGNSNNRLNLEADITKTTDVDVYKITLPTTGPAVVGVKFDLIAGGVSSLQASLKVYDGGQKLLGTQAANKPGENLTFQVTQPTAGGSYFVRVAGNAGGNGFDIGSYKLKIVYQYADGTTSAGAASTASSNPFSDNENHTNDRIDLATNIAPRAGNTPDARFDYAYTGSLIDSTDVDFYKVKAPSWLVAPKMNVIVWGIQPNSPAPKVEVFDALYQPISAVLLSNQDGTFSVEVPKTVAGTNYFIKVSALNPSGSYATGNYYLGVDFNNQPVTTFSTNASGTITSSTSVVTQTLTVSQNQLFDFQFGVNAGPNGNWTQGRVELVNASGQVVFSLNSYSGFAAATNQVYLQAGTYTVRYAAAAVPGSTLLPTAFTLKGRMISDPIGPTRVSSGVAPPPSTAVWTDPTTTTLVDTVMSWQMAYYW